MENGRKQRKFCCAIVLLCSEVNSKEEEMPPLSKIHFEHFCLPRLLS